MPPEPTLCFGPYRLAGPQGPLWQAAQVVPVRPKALAVLWTLVHQAGLVVTKETLLEQVWPETVVSEGVLASCVRLLRRVLGEDPQQPQYIATVHRVGYRFMAPVTPVASGPPPALVATSPVSTPARVPAAPSRSPDPLPPLSLSPPPLLVGRQGELARLHTGWSRALQGARQLLFVTGEAGMGKTTLIETFLAQLAPVPPRWVGRGQCIEHYGAGEAYLPLLDALGRLGQGPDGAPLVALLRQMAPTWLAQLPALCSADDLVALQQTVPGTTWARMLRELVEVLERLTAVQPLVLVLEDLHWSDASTVEVLALLGRRREAARLLVLGMYRPVELLVQSHPLKAVKQELVAHGQATELPLAGLEPEAVAAYLAQRGGLDTAAQEEVAAVVYRRTEGHPLFMVQLVEALAQQGPLPVGRPSGVEVESARVPDVPPGLKDLLEAQLGRLGTTAQQVLEGGSVAGAEFVGASVAAGLEMAPAAVEAVCEALARQGQFLEDRGLAEWPDGTVSGRYGWRHALYQEVVYQRLGAGRQARWHRMVGERLEQAYGIRAHEIAAELALHFQRGQDTRRAVQYLGQAAETAAQRQAPREVIALLTTALELLATLPETPARAQQELDLYLVLASALSDAKSPAAPEVEQTYARIRALCAQVGETPQRLQMLLGFYWFHLARGVLSTTWEVGEELAQLAQRTARPTDLLTAHGALGYTAFLRGDYGAAQTHCAQDLAWLDPPTQRAQVVRYGYAPGVFCLSTVANTLWCLGCPVQAGQHSAEALALATTQGFPHYVGFGTFGRGWALTRQGQWAAGLAQMHQGLATVVATGTLVTRPLSLVWLAEATGQAGDVDAGLRLLDEALEAFATSGRGDGLAEACRLKGELLLQAGGRPQAEAATACFQQALSIARRQQAKSWELRAAMSLARLWQQQGNREAARALLAPIYSWFTEGFDTADIQEAKALLVALQG